MKLLDIGIILILCIWILFSVVCLMKNRKSGGCMGCAGCTGGACRKNAKTEK